MAQLGAIGAVVGAAWLCQFLVLAVTQPHWIVQLRDAWNDPVSVAAPASRVGLAGAYLGVTWVLVAVLIGVVTYDRLDWIGPEWGGIVKGGWVPLRPAIAYASGWFGSLGVLVLLIKAAERIARGRY